MAGEWIKVEKSTADKPEVLRVARILGIDKDAVVGKLVRLWCWFDMNSVDGVVDGVVDADVDQLCNQVGFSSALVSVGWLDVDLSSERVSLPNFGRHNGESAKKRVLKSERQAKWRSGAKSVDVSVDAPVSTSATTREEKRRKEIQTVSADAELSPTDKPTPPLKAKDLVAEGVDPQAAADWLALRKAKRLPLTATAWDDTKAEGQKLGLTPAQAVAHAVTHNWAGFRASWLDQNRPGQATPAKNIFAGAL